MVTRKQSTDFLDATGRSWEDWLKFLDGIKASELNHTEIAKRIMATGLTNGWWSQGITVAYEQHIGRRAPGQRADGTFEISVTRTFDGAMDEVLSRWAKMMEGRTKIGGVAGAKAPETSGTAKRCYWRWSLQDGTRVVVTAEPKGEDKVLLAVVHQKLASADEAERWRAVWKDEVLKL